MSRARQDYDDFGEEPPHEVRSNQDNAAGLNSADNRSEDSANLDELLECWRCGKLGFRKAEFCLYCRAPLFRGSTPARAPVWRQDGRGTTPVPKVLGLFLIFLGFSVVFGFVIRFGFDPEKFRGEQGARRLHLIELVVEGLDTLLVIVGLIWIGRVPSLPRQSLSVRILTWCAAPSILLLLILLNFAYHRMIRQLIQVPLLEEDLLAHKNLIWLIILTVCVQPAIVEELFFRYLALGGLRSVTGIHGAVLISSVMFGMAHIFNPLGIPYLIGVGVVLGYMRVASSSLVLPIVMHFGHNLAVVYLA
jgi:membrane protease YdiL (CAAX protease family)